MQLLARGGTSHSIGSDVAALLAHLTAADHHLSRDLATLAGFTGTSTSLSLDVAQLLAHLTGTTTSLGGSGASWVEHWSVAGTTPGLGVDTATLHARLTGASAAQGADRAALLAYLTGPHSGTGSGGAGAQFATHAPETVMFDAAGAHTYTIPAWCTHLDLVAIGGGASGQTGSGFNGSRGDGGNAGSWAAKTVIRSTSWGASYVTWSTTTMDVTVGAGGAQAPNSDLAGPNNGEASGVEIWLTANGGSGTTSGQNGASPGNTTYRGTTYTGGTGGTGNGGHSTNPPGGGGAGGNGGIFGRRTRGGYGGRGRVWITARQEF